MLARARCVRVSLTLHRSECQPLAQIKEGVWDCWTERGEVGVKSGKEREGGDTSYRQPIRDAA